MSTLSDRRSIIIKVKPQTRREAMVEIVKGFPDRLHRTEAYDRIEAVLARRFPFNRTDNTWRQDITRARKDAAFRSDGHWWVRQK